MSGEVKTAGASAGSDGLVVNQRLNKAREAIAIPWETQMMLEGRVFMAGTGGEEDGRAGIADINEQTPTFGLVAPAGGVVLVPLWFRVYYDIEAAAAPEHIAFVYVQATKAAFSAGTLLPALNCLGGKNPRVAQGKMQHSLTALTAFTAAQNVMLTAREHILNDLESVEGAATKTNIERFDTSMFELNWKPQFPVGLYEGAGLYFYAIDTTARYNAAFAWIEVPVDTYLP